MESSSAASIYSSFLGPVSNLDEIEEPSELVYKKRECSTCGRKCRRCCCCGKTGKGSTSAYEAPPRGGILGWFSRKLFHRHPHIPLTEEETEWRQDLGRAQVVTKDFKNWLDTTYRKDRTAPASIRKQLSRARRSWYVSMTDITGRGGSIISTDEFKETDAPVIENMMKLIGSWNFNSFDLDEKTDGRSLSFVVQEIFKEQDFIRKFRIKVGPLKELLKAFEAGYTMNGNEYHNQRHAADVTQTVYAILSTRPVLYRMFTDLEIFALIFAAIIHDLAHPGTSNNFQVNSQSHLALLYNDRSVLENHHVSSAFQILRNPTCNILEHMKIDEFKEFRFLVIDFVLATDMAGHFQHLHKIRNYVKSGNWEGTSSKANSSALSFILHAADVGNPTKPWDNHKKCADAVMMEYQAQGIREKSLKLDISPLCNPKDQTPDTQITFIEVLVMPTFEALGELLDLITSAISDSEANIKGERRRRFTLTDNSTDEANTKKSIRISVMAKILRRNSKADDSLRAPWQANLIANIAHWKRLGEAMTRTTSSRSTQIHDSSVPDRKSKNQLELVKKPTIKFSQVQPTVVKSETSH